MTNQTTFCDLARQLGELPAARTTLERALAITEAAYVPDHPTSPSPSATWASSTSSWRIRSSLVTSAAPLN